MQKFQARQHLAAFAANQARHAASEVLVRLQVRQNQFLCAHHARGNRHQSAASADVEIGNCATPLELKLALPSEFPPSLKLTLPDATGLLPFFTVAVRVVTVPWVTGFGLAVTVTVVACRIVTVCVEEWDAVSVASPLYEATTL